MDEVAALEQLKSLHQRKTQQIEHVKTLTADFRQWRGDFTAQLGAQREDMQNMRKQLHEDAMKQRSEFQEMQAELQRQLEDLISSNLSAFPVLEAAEQPRPREPEELQEPQPPPLPPSEPQHPPPHSGAERRGAHDVRTRSEHVGARKASARGAREPSLAMKLSHELGIPVELLASSSSSRPAPEPADVSRPAPVPAEPEPRRSLLRRETAADAKPHRDYGAGAAARQTRSQDTDDESTASSRFSGGGRNAKSARSARSDTSSPTSSAYSDDSDGASDYSDYSSSEMSDRSGYSDSVASSYSASVGSRHSMRGGSNGDRRR